ncbi:MAG: serpin family protein, partial [Chloroflexota bacterium]
MLNRMLTASALLLLVLVGPAAAQDSEGAADDDTVAAVAGANTTFAFDLYQMLRGETPANVFVSPYSISQALAMTYAGAQGETADQMAEVLAFDLAAEPLSEAFGALTADLTGREYALPPALPGAEEPTGFEFSVANALWGQAGF